MGVPPPASVIRWLSSTLSEGFQANANAVRRQCPLWPNETRASSGSALPRLSSRRFRPLVCDFDVRSGWQRDGAWILGTREAVECLLFVLDRTQCRRQVKSGFRWKMRGFCGQNPPVGGVLPGFWATVNKNPEWLISRKTGFWRFSPKLISDFQIGLLDSDVPRFIGLLKIPL